jgi:AcrR family transcriptional regulator
MARNARYRQLLQAARAIVERGGASALTMSALTVEAGVSRPVVYEHFENSEAIAVALLEDYFEQIVDLVDTRTQDAQTLDEYLALAIAAEFEYHAADSLLVRNLTNGHATGKGLNEAFLTLRQRTIDTFQELLSQQGASDETARIGGYALAEIIPNVVYQFSSDPIADTARQLLTDMVLGAIHAMVPQTRARPETPAQVLQASRELKRMRDDAKPKRSSRPR